MHDSLKGKANFCRFLRAMRPCNRSQNEETVMVKNWRLEPGSAMKVMALSITVRSSSSFPRIFSHKPCNSENQAAGCWRGAHVAVKVLTYDLEDSQAGASIAREAVIGAALSHPNVVSRLTPDTPSRLLLGISVFSACSTSVHSSLCCHQCHD